MTILTNQQILWLDVSVNDRVWPIMQILYSTDKVLHVSLDLMFRQFSIVFELIINRTSLCILKQQVHLILLDEGLMELDDVWMI